MTRIAFLLYPDMTALHAVGPYEVLARLPGADVRKGKVITAAGVSAGIDMALRPAAMEAGEDEARALQLGIEYDPDPPFDSVAFEQAEPATRRRATAHMVPDAQEARIAA